MSVIVTHFAHVTGKQSDNKQNHINNIRDPQVQQCLQIQIRLDKSLSDLKMY